MLSLLFVCVANSFRSQMAEAMAKSLGEASWEIWSAGSHPSGALHPFAIDLMRERGIGLNGHRSKGLDEVPRKLWDYVVTMGCEDDCPQVQARHHLAWEIPDPAGRSLDDARRIRDQLEQQIRELMS